MADLFTDTPADLATIQGALSTTQGLFNFKKSNTRRLRKARANARTGLARSKLGFIGDSTTLGVGGGTGGGNVDNWAASHPTRIAQILSAAGVPAVSQCRFGGGGYTTMANLTATDTRFTATGNWSLAATQSLGGQAFTSSDTSVLSWAPTIQFDTIVVYYAQNTGLGSFNIGVDGGAALGATVTTAGSAALASTTRTTTLGTHTINFTGVSGSRFIIGWAVYNSASKAIDIFNFGWAGSTSAEWIGAGSPFNPLPAVAAIGLDVAFINDGINDWSTSVPVATYKANIQSLITSAATTADVILCAPCPSDVSWASVAVQAQYIQALYELAISNDIPLVDWTRSFESYAIANAAGFYFDTRHPLAIGYSDMAELVAGEILRV